MALQNKNQDVVKHSSSYMLGNSVRVHVNPLLEQCVVDGRLASDLEFALQTKDPAYISSVATRQPQYGNSGSRHVSASDAADMLGACNDELQSFTDGLKNASSSSNSNDNSSPDSSGNSD